MRTVAEMIDELCERLLIEHDDGTLPDEVYIELQACLKKHGSMGTLSEEQLNMPWDQFVEEIERRGETQ
jgi:hypothetical protein